MEPARGGPTTVARMGGTITPEPAAARGNEPRRTLRAKEWATIHAGPAVKCYNIIFAAWSDPQNEGGQPAIAIYLDGDGQNNLVKSLSVGESTEICGKSIRVYGLLRGVQVAHWRVSEDGITDWFE
jgi:hypothetical protein